jgi:hypothetical protein
LRVVNERHAVGAHRRVESIVVDLIERVSKTLGRQAINPQRVDILDVAPDAASNGLGGERPRDLLPPQRSLRWPQQSCD